MLWGQLRLQYFAQEYFDTETGGAGDRSTNLPIGRQAAVSSQELSFQQKLYRTHPLHPMVRPSRVLQVQKDTIERPCEGKIHSCIMGGMALQRHILTLIYVGIRRGQRDLGGICEGVNGSD